MLYEDNVRLQHILEEAKEACKYVEGYSLDDFLKDGKTARAIIRSIEVIGEAASKISKEYRIEQPEVPWNKIIGMRNHLIHVYFEIDYDTVWKTVQDNIPAPIGMVEKLLEED